MRICFHTPCQIMRGDTTFTWQSRIWRQIEKDEFQWRYKRRYHYWGWAMVLLSSGKWPCRGCAYFPFPGMNEVIFISEKNGKINDVRIPFKNTLYYENFYWQEFEETVVVETYFNNKYHTWVWKYDEPPTDITPNGREDRLVSAMMHGDSVVLFILTRKNPKLYLPYTIPSISH